MKITRALAIRQECADNFRGLFSHAAAFHLSHAAMLEKRSEVYAKTAKAPRYVRAYLEGVWDTLQAQAYHESLVFGGIVGGRFYSTHSDRPDYYGKHGIAPSEFADNGKVSARGHYWRENAFIQDVSPFSVDKP